MVLVLEKAVGHWPPAFSLFEFLLPPAVTTLFPDGVHGFRFHSSPILSASTIACHLN